MALTSCSQLVITILEETFLRVHYINTLKRDFSDIFDCVHSIDIKAIVMH